MARFQGGVFIHEIHAGGVAEKTGVLHQGDLVTKVTMVMVFMYKEDMTRDPHHRNLDDGNIDDDDGAQRTGVT